MCLLLQVLLLFLQVLSHVRMFVTVAVVAVEAVKKETTTVVAVVAVEVVNLVVVQQHLQLGHMP
jgi:hypothetical protein